MTLLVGILCSDGAVIAADRQVTHGGLGRVTVGYPGSKITEVAHDILFASSGAVSLGQQIGNIFEERKQNIRTAKYFDEITRLQGKILAILKPAFDGANMVAPMIGQNAAAMDAICGCIFAAKFFDGLKLVEVSPQAQFSFLSDRLPFTTMGSGKANADPFLSFLFSIYWKDKLPTVQGGILTAYWTIRTAIESASQGVGFDIDVSVISGSGDSYSVKNYLEKDLGEHQDFIQAAKDALRGVRDKMLGVPGDQATQQDEPPPSLS